MYKMNYILDSMRIFMKAFHNLLLFNRSFIFSEYILIFGIILLLMIDSTFDKKDISWLYFISSVSLVTNLTGLLFCCREECMINLSRNFQMNNFNEIFQFLILLYMFNSMYSPISRVHKMYKNSYIRIYVIRINNSYRGMFLSSLTI